jgi:hypothetical protein
LKYLLTISAIVVASFLLASPAVHAQAGMDFDEFTRRADPYFAEDLLGDVRMAMPQGSNYKIWGWDVGDFSGDGFYDLALSVHILGTRKKECVVYMFVDVEGYLVPVSRMPFQYVELPLEVGVVIKDVACYVTQKRKSEDWSIRGYRFTEGAVVLVDEFISDKIEAFQHESFRSFQTLRTSERLANRKNEEVFTTEFLTIPCYSRSRQIYAGYVSEVTVATTSHVPEGAYWWTGESDVSFSARMVYDEDHLYARVYVRDSNVVTGWCDTCIADHVELLFDVAPPAEGSRSRYLSRIDREEVVVRSASDSGLYTFTVRLGDFGDNLPRVAIKTTDELDPAQVKARKQLRVVTAQRPDGYVVKLRIPFALLGYQKAPIDEQGVVEFGCAIAVVDYDNEFRPEERSVIATSNVESLDPSTYGALRFVPDGTWYGESVNIYGDAVVNTLRELGF